jgi:hypothetical protein
MQGGEPIFKQRDPAAMLAQPVEHAIHLLVETIEIDDGEVLGRVGHDQKAAPVNESSRRRADVLPIRP